MATFGNLSDRLAETFKNLRTNGKLSAADIDGTVREIRRALLDADVSLDVVKQFTAHVRERALGDEVNRALNPAQQVVQIVNEELVAILGGEQRRLRFAKNPPTVIMLAGLQGTGKTTLAGKLGKWLVKDGHTPILVAADLQRPNAVNQLQIVGAQAGVAVFAPEPGNGVGDPVRVAKEALKHAERAQHDVVIIDTAGRLGVDAEMMKQAANIRKATDPDEVLFVIDAMIGQDAVTTAKAFQEGVDFTGVVLSKLDGDARGGAALSVASVTGRPIIFASTGEGLDDFEPFHPDRMASRILGMGDMLTLIEKAEAAFDEEEAAKAEKKLRKGQFTLEDFLDQMQQVRKMGPIQNLVGMMPGLPKEARDAEVDESQLGRIEAIIRSMTPEERRNPAVINGSRRLRIARGSGTSTQDVNGMLKQFKMVQQMMRSVAKGKMPRLPVPGR
jgi:signal recognition particle subunit SRP54